MAWPDYMRGALAKRTRRELIKPALPVRVAAAVLVLAFLALAGAQNAHAWVIPASAPREPECPAIPDAKDVQLTAEEMQRVQAGEIVVHVGEMGEHGRHVFAIGYLDANPVWLFDVGTDASLAPDLSAIIERVDVLEKHEHGKRVHGVVDPAALLPKYEYTLAVSYLADQTGQCWAQIEGDFNRNAGSHSYLWDPARQETLSVFTFDLSLKGMLRIIPDGLVRRLTARTLPDFMRNLERYAIKLEREDPERAAAIERRWNELRPRLEANEVPGRVWRGPSSDTVEISLPARVESVSTN
jgi:hypothetical protein